MATVIKHLIALGAMSFFAALYGMATAYTRTDWMTTIICACFILMLTFSYMYIYEAAPNALKIFGVVFMPLSCSMVLYISWIVWITIRSDFQIYLISDPQIIWQEIYSLALNTNNNVVHLRYPVLESGSTKLISYWILEAITVICLPILFAVRAVTGYSDTKLPAHEIHERHASSPN